jgi:hypothetical protein
MASYYAAGNGCNGSGSAGRALGRGVLCQRKQGSSGEHGTSYFRFHLVFLLKSGRWMKLDPNWWIRLCEIGRMSDAGMGPSGPSGYLALACVGATRGRTS